MRKTCLISGLLIFGLIAASNVAFVDKPGADWIPMEKVIVIVKKAGYSQVSELEADDGHWEGDGLKDGKKYEFHVDPHSGKITKDEQDD